MIGQFEVEVTAVLRTVTAHNPIRKENHESARIDTNLRESIPAF
jgi:hypothetical protein